MVHRTFRLCLLSVCSSLSAVLQVALFSCSTFPISLFVASGIQSQQQSPSSAVHFYTIFTFPASQKPNIEYLLQVLQVRRSSIEPHCRGNSFFTLSSFVSTNRFVKQNRIHDSSSSSHRITHIQLATYDFGGLMFIFSGRGASPFGDAVHMYLVIGR